jgi:hypothetical protein
MKAWAIKGPDGTLSLPLKKSDAWTGHDDVDVEYLKAQGFTCVEVTVTEASEDQREPDAGFTISPSQEGDAEKSGQRSGSHQTVASEQPAQGMVSVPENLLTLFNADLAFSATVSAINADLIKKLDVIKEQPAEGKGLGWRDPRLMSDAELAQDWVKSKRSE